MGKLAGADTGASAGTMLRTPCTRVSDLAGAGAGAGTVLRTPRTRVGELAGAGAGAGTVLRTPRTLGGELAGAGAGVGAGARELALPSQTQLQNDKSNAGVTSPVSQHPSPETITISH